MWQWKEADQSAFMDSKLKCVFDYVEDSDTPAGSNTGATVSVMNITYSDMSGSEYFNSLE